MSDLSLSILPYALDALTLRQQAASNNIANVQTPGYTAQTVSFESSLKAALSQGQGTPAAQVSVGQSNAPAATDGNNVNLPAEMVTAQTTSLQYQATVNALQAQYRILASSESASF